MQLYLAPLHGVTNRVFRSVYLRRFPGFDAAFAPFILSVAAGGITERHLKDLLPDARYPVPLVPQILGKDAAGFVATAEAIAGLGYTEVNWNLGCPYPMVAGKGRGSGLLPHPDRIAAFLDEVCPRLSIPLSVKLRLGMRDRGEILRLMPLLNGYPLKEVIIHARLGVQMYKGDVDLEGFERAAALCGHPVAYNGDIADAAGLEALRSRFPGVTRWMIGRGALADPFLCGRIAGRPEDADPLGAVAAFHDELYASYREILSGPGHALAKMKEVWTYLGPSMVGADAALAAISRSKTFPAYESAVAAAFSGGSWKPSAERSSLARAPAVAAARA